MTSRVREGGGERLIGLELLRFVAALGVLVWHYQHFMCVGHTRIGWDWDHLPFRWLLLPFYTYGYDGVELFWCISGFVFCWKYSAVISRGALSFRRFGLLRFSRLYPLHFATLLIVAALQALYFAQHGQTFVYLYNDAAHFIMNLFFANWWGFQSGESFNGPSWSVSAEVLIYLVFFWISRLFGGGWRIEGIALFWFAGLGYIVKARSGITLSFTGGGTFFYTGMLTCRVYQRIVMLPPRRRRQTGWGCLGIIAVSAVLVDRHVLAIAGGSLALYPALIILVQLAVRPENQRVQAWLAGLGNMTYASYMLHFPVQLGIMLTLGMLAVPVQGLVYSDWFMLAYLGIVLALSFVVFRRVERPAQDWLRGLSRRQRSSAAVSAKHSGVIL